MVAPVTDLANGAPSAPSKFEIAPAKKKRGKAPWKWQVTAFLKGDKVASQTVHNSELAKDLEVQAQQKREDIVRVEVEEA
jgi:hypothetical protein